MKGLKIIKTETAHKAEENGNAEKAEKQFRKKYEKYCAKMMKAFEKSRSGRLSRNYDKLQKLIFRFQANKLSLTSQMPIPEKEMKENSKRDISFDIDQQIFLAKRRNLDFEEITMSKKDDKEKVQKSLIFLKSCRLCLQNGLLTPDRIIFETDVFFLIVPERCKLIRQSSLWSFPNCSTMPLTFDESTD
jgi:hypothetical protein